MLLVTQRALIAALLCAPGISAQQPGPSAAELLKPYQFLMGTWTAEGEMPGAGKFSVTRTYRGQFGNKVMLVTEVMRTAAGEITREMWLGVDPAKQSLAGWVFSSDGSYAALAGAQSTPDALVLEGRLSGGAEPGLYRSTTRREGGDRLTQTIEAQRDGAWSRSTEIHYTRSSGSVVTVPRATAPASAAVQPLDLLAGDWRAEGESDGAKYAVDYNIYWTLGGHFLRSNYSVTTNQQTEFHAAAYMFFDPETKSLTQVGFSIEGSVASMKITASPPSLTYEGVMITPTRRMPLRLTYTRATADSLTITTESQRQDGSWRRSPAAAFTRRPH